MAEEQPQNLKQRRVLLEHPPRLLLPAYSIRDAVTLFRFWLVENGMISTASALSKELEDRRITMADTADIPKADLQQHVALCLSRIACGQSMAVDLPGVVTTDDKSTLPNHGIVETSPALNLAENDASAHAVVAFNRGQPRPSATSAPPVPSSDAPTTLSQLESAKAMPVKRQSLWDVNQKKSGAPHMGHGISLTATCGGLDDRPAPGADIGSMKMGGGDQDASHKKEEKYSRQSVGLGKGSRSEGDAAAADVQDEEKGIEDEDAEMLDYGDEEEEEEEPQRDQDRVGEGSSDHLHSVDKERSQSPRDNGRRRSQSEGRERDRGRRRHSDRGVHDRRSRGHRSPSRSTSRGVSPGRWGRSSSPGTSRSHSRGYSGDPSSSPSARRPPRDSSPPRHGRSDRRRESSREGGGHKAWSDREDRGGGSGRDDREEPASMAGKPPRPRGGAPKYLLDKKKFPSTREALPRPALGGVNAAGEDDARPPRARGTDSAGEGDGHGHQQQLVLNLAEVTEHVQDEGGVREDGRERGGGRTHDEGGHRSPGTKPLSLSSRQPRHVRGSQDGRRDQRDPASYPAGRTAEPSGGSQAPAPYLQGGRTAAASSSAWAPGFDRFTLRGYDLAVRAGDGSPIIGLGLGQLQVGVPLPYVLSQGGEADEKGAPAGRDGSRERKRSRHEERDRSRERSR